MLEQVTDPLAAHGEGPVWFPRWPGLRWVDMLAGDVLTLVEDTGEVRRDHVGTVAAALRPRESGGAVLALERGFAFADDALQDVRPLPELWSGHDVRMNEGGCGPDGAFYCGSMAYAETPGAGALYRLDPQGRVDTVLHEVTISNGLMWTQDGSRAYYADTPTQRVDVFEFDEGRLVNRRPFAQVDPADGSPDGLAVDAEGGVWVALWGGGAVRHYTADGALAEVIEVPAPKVTSCTFGGADLDRLYITTSQTDTDLDQHPGAGAVFATDPGVRGLAVRTYAG
ncbi:SMP-30/gluconolactonase/LRE family protein [Saccharopolyspora rhizosphaerae]|uniref:SMP-30/gluconolactonase/LRE family protein n=1 Tax=Saccharopolyspora rhizosphaerae TaxID=2492662 RepID=A0A426K5H4_9PSEU|nr:SMP-30/gluconolactonase/LRE family protein [Saccharopolyspora rhizosphaerae]RRO20638.1 SMP-30/gluconolactonase/LRE family protein [Saccharopolyspora rhizosphaerae]